MRLVLPAIFCLLASSAVAEGPFTPPGVNPPDYAMTIATSASSHPGSQIVLLHHGDWTRVAVAADSSAVDYYLAHDRGKISISARPDYVRFLWILRGPDHLSLSISPASIEYAPRDTGDRQTHLGESCTVWEVWRAKPSKPGGPDLIHSSCVTDDGIELSRKSLNSITRDVVSSAEATQIERRPLSPEDVRPPKSVFAPDWPDRDTLPVFPETPDHEVVMEKTMPPRENGKVTRRVRRHGSLQLTEETAGKLRTIQVMDDFFRISLHYASDESGTPKHLSIFGSGLNDETPAEIRKLYRGFRRSDRTDTVLGESCHWFSMSVSFKEGTTTCLTEDSVPLKERHFEWHFDPLSKKSDTEWSEWTAIRVARRPITMDEIMPAELLSPQTWGVE